MCPKTLGFSNLQEMWNLQKTPNTTQNVKKKKKKNFSALKSSRNMKFTKYAQHNPKCEDEEEEEEEF